MVSLLVFSTIGVNVISAFCGGCNEQHSEIAYSNVENLDCDCCETEAAKPSCCAKSETQNHLEHESEASYLKLDVLSSESNNETQLQADSFIILFLFKGFTENLLEGFTHKTNLFSEKLKLTGRYILQLNCVMRN